MGDLVVLRPDQRQPAHGAAEGVAGRRRDGAGRGGGLLPGGAVARLLPYFLAVASSSFVYVALADLIPQLQKSGSRRRETIAQIAWLIAGMVVVMMVSGLAHNH